MDRILIKDLRARCIIGVAPEERQEKQEVLISLALSVDTRKPGRSDRFEDAVDYRALKKQVMELVEASQFYLIEALAERVAELCLEQAGVEAVRVTIEKPSALRFARTVGVEIRRRG